MPRRILVYATLLLAAFLVGRWYVDTLWITETLQAVAAGHVESTAASITVSAAEPGQSRPRSEIILLGTGAPFPYPDRSGPAVMIRVDGVPYIVDAGVGVVRRAAAAFSLDDKLVIRRGVQQLRVAFVTHLHSDHTLGLADLILTPWIVGRKDPITLYGPNGLKAMTENLLDAYNEDIDIRIHGLERSNTTGHNAVVHEIEPGVVYEDERATVTAFEVNHGSWKQAFGYRFDTPDQVIVISGDLAPSENIVKFCNGCDVLLHEAYSMAGHEQSNEGSKRYLESFHTSTIELAELANRAQAKVLLIYHQVTFGQSTVDDIVEELQDRFDGELISGRDLGIY